MTRNKENTKIYNVQNKIVLERTSRLDEPKQRGICKQEEKKYGFSLMLNKEYHQTPREKRNIDIRVHS